MKISKDEVLHIARLSRLEFDDAQLAAMGEHLDRILDRFRVLDSVDTSSVPATAHILDLVNVLREDVAVPPMPREKLLANAPESDGEAYIVPRVLE